MTLYKTKDNGLILVYYKLCKNCINNIELFTWDKEELLFYITKEGYKKRNSVIKIIDISHNKLAKLLYL